MIIDHNLIILRIKCFHLNKFRDVLLWKILTGSASRSCPPIGCSGTLNVGTYHVIFNSVHLSFVSDSSGLQPTDGRCSKRRDGQMNNDELTLASGREDGAGTRFWYLTLYFQWHGLWLCPVVYRQFIKQLVWHFLFIIYNHFAVCSQIGESYESLLK